MRSTAGIRQEFEARQTSDLQASLDAMQARLAGIVVSIDETLTRFAQLDLRIDALGLKVDEVRDVATRIDEKTPEPTKEG